MADFDKIDKRDFDILVAKCGKSIGLKGEIRLIVYSDFSEIFTQGNVFLCKSEKSHGNQLLGASCVDLPNFECSQTTSLVSHSKFGKNSTTSTAIPSIVSNGNAKLENSAFFLTLKSFNPHKQSAFFDEINSVESAKNLTSMLLYSSAFLTQKYCHLGENEHFWFEIVGMSVVDNGEIMGAVSDIERIGSVDYLLVATNPAILAKYPHIKAKKFYLPYIPRYILQVEKRANETKGTIFVCDSLGILEES